MVYLGDVGAGILASVGKFADATLYTDLIMPVPDSAMMMLMLLMFLAQVVVGTADEVTARVCGSSLEPSNPKARDTCPVPIWVELALSSAVLLQEIIPSKIHTESNRIEIFFILKKVFKVKQIYFMVICSYLNYMCDK